MAEPQVAPNPIPYLPSPWERITDWFGGKSHFSFLAAYVGISVAFYLHTSSPNFPIFAGCLLSLCGCQHYRSVAQDNIKDAPEEP